MNAGLRTNTCTVHHLAMLLAAAVTFFALGMNAARLRPVVNSYFHGIHWELLTSLVALLIFSAAFVWDRRSTSLTAKVLWYEAKCMAIWSMFTLGWALLYDEKTGPPLTGFFIIPLGWFCFCAIVGGVASAATGVRAKPHHG